LIGADDGLGKDRSVSDIVATADTELSSLKTLHRIVVGRNRGYWDPEVKIHLKIDTGSPSDAAETRLLFPSFDRFDATIARATTRHIRGVEERELCEGA